MANTDVRKILWIIYLYGKKGILPSIWILWTFEWQHSSDWLENYLYLYMRERESRREKEREFPINSGESLYLYIIYICLYIQIVLPSATRVLPFKSIRRHQFTFLSNIEFILYPRKNWILQPMDNIKIRKAAKAENAATNLQTKSRNSNLPCHGQPGNVLNAHPASLAD